MTSLQHRQKQLHPLCHFWEPHPARQVRQARRHLIDLNHLVTQSLPTHVFSFLAEVSKRDTTQSKEQQDFRNFTTLSIVNTVPPLLPAVPPQAFSRPHAAHVTNFHDGAVQGPSGNPVIPARPESRSWCRPPGPIPSHPRQALSQSWDVRSELHLTRPGLRAQELGSEVSRGTRP